MIPKVVVDGANILGESAFWWATAQQVYWVDGVAGEIHRWDPVSNRRATITVPDAPLGMIAGTMDPDILVLANAKGVGLFDLDKRTLSPVCEPEQGREGIGYNDGKVDPRGRLWLGTYDASETEPRGTLWLLRHGARPRLADTGMAVVNGPAFSPDGRTLYVSDSIGRRILAYDVRDEVLIERRVLAAFVPEEGLPDGLTVDADGGLWCAHWDGARVTRFSPTGERLAVIRMPVPRVTSVAFGGRNLDVLFITTARYGLSEEQLAVAPTAGALFAAVPGVTGIAATPLPLPFAVGPGETP